MKSKVFGQGVGSGSRAWMGRVGMGGRFGREIERRASRSVGASRGVRWSASG